MNCAHCGAEDHTLNNCTSLPDDPVLVFTLDDGILEPRTSADIDDLLYDLRDSMEVLREPPLSVGAQITITTKLVDRKTLPG